MTERPTLKEIEAAARVLHKAGTHHHWWKPYDKSYDEMAATDSIAKSEFDGIVEQMLMAANEARLHDAEVLLAAAKARSALTVVRSPMAGKPNATE